MTDFPPGRATANLQSALFNRVFGIEKDRPLDRLYYRGFEEHSVRVLPYDSSGHGATLVTLTFFQ